MMSRFTYATSVQLHSKNIPAHGMGPMSEDTDTYPYCESLGLALEWPRHPVAPGSDKAGDSQLAWWSRKGL